MFLGGPFIGGENRSWMLCLNLFLSERNDLEENIPHAFTNKVKSAGLPTIDAVSKSRSIPSR
jgi:hypothetical protein